MTDPALAAVLAQRTAFVIGAGAAGTAAAVRLVGAGFGRVSVVDGGIVERKDLGRTPLFFNPDIGAGKAENLAMKLSIINPACHVDPFPAYADESNAALIVDGADIVIECTNQAEPRAAIDDACATASISLIGTSIDGYDGELLTVAPGACLRALSESGVAKPGAGSITGTLAAITAIKLSTGKAEGVAGELVSVRAEIPEVSKKPAACRGDCTCRNRENTATV